MNKFVCKHCGFSFEKEPSNADSDVAKQLNETELVKIWVCPKCGKDNKTTIKAAE